MAVEDNTPSITDDVALLSEESPVEEIVAPPKKEVKKVEEPIEETEKAIEELEVEEEKEEAEEEEEPKEFLPHERPTMAQIREKFPDLFKTFPTLKAAIAREKQFSEIFHTPAEASETASLADEYSALRDDVVAGTGEKLLPALKESDSLGKFSKNFLPNLYKTDKDLHWQTIAPVLEDFVRAAYSNGTRNHNDNLKNAALVISEALLGDLEIAEGKKSLVQREAPKDAKVDEEKQKYENTRYNDFNIDVHEALYESLKSEISNGLKVEGLTDFMKNSITQAIINQISDAVKADKTFTAYKDKLWKEAKSNGYRREDKSRIINASLARAKSLIPSLRRKLISEALGSSPSEGQKRQEKVEQIKSRREPGSQGRPNSPSTRMPSAKRIDWRKTSDFDVLNDNIKLKD